MGQKIVLIATNPCGEKGSMARYAGLLASSLSDVGVQVQVVNLALPLWLLEKFPTRFRMWFHHLWILLTAPLRLWLQKADAYHVLDGSHAYVAHFLPAAVTVVTAHDIIPLLQMQGAMKGQPPGRGGRVIIQQSIRGLQRAGHVVCDSMSTKEDICAYTSIPRSRLSMIHPALSVGHKVGVPSWISRRLVKSPYLFHIGHNGYYKNRVGVLRIFAGILKVVSEMHLKMAGPAPSEDLLQQCEALGISSRVEFIVYPDDDQVAELYQHACLFLFPSRYEGFGWPPLEAMASGCPVICSSAGSLAEVAGDAAIVEDVDDEAAMVAHAIEILNQQEVAEHMVQRGYERIKHFKPATMAGALMQIYRQVSD